MRCLFSCIIFMLLVTEVNIYHSLQHSKAFVARKTTQVKENTLVRWTATIEP